MSKIIIESRQRKNPLNLHELFAYKDLFITLALRDFKVRYAQTFLGLFWAIIQPLITLLILILIFNKVIGIKTDPVPYPLFALAGICSWNYFSFVATQVGSSLIGAQNMIHKIYFPRLIVPLSKASVGLLDFAMMIVLVFAMMIYYGIKPGLHIIWFPFFILLSVISAIAAGIWLSALTVRFRDFQIIIPYMIQAGMYITPVAYPIQLIPPEYKILFYLNPMTSIVQGFRWSLLGLDKPDLYSLLSFILVIILFISGLYYFKKTERIMADIL